MKLDPFYLIVDSADWVESLVPLGVKLVQLRMKDQPTDEIRAHLRRAKAVCDSYGCLLVINDYWEIAIDERCDFVHLGQEDLQDADLAAIRKVRMRLGVSTHDERELDCALAVKPDYLALGPIWPTILKKMKWAPQGLERLGDWKRRIGSLPLVAIGGLNVERIDSVFAAGADCGAVVTDITLNHDPQGRVAQWLSKTAPYR
jgi:thiamine-phosphate pyrophosphorylase